MARFCRVFDSSATHLAKNARILAYWVPRLRRIPAKFRWLRLLGCIAMPTGHMAILTFRRFFLFLLLLLLVTGIWRFLPGRDAPAVQQEPAPVRVDTAVVMVRDMPVRVTGLGVVQPWASVTVRPRIDGQLESVGFKEGDVVHAGQEIARLDDRLQQALLAQALAQRDHDRVQLENARADLQRYTELARHSAINRQTLDTQKAQVAALEATLKSHDAQVQYARAQLDYTRITAPVSGRTGALLLDPGNQVRAADAQGLVTIHQIDPIAVSFSVSDTVYSQVHAAMRNDEAIRVEVYDRTVMGSGAAHATPAGPDAQAEAADGPGSDAANNPEAANVPVAGALHDFAPGLMAAGRLVLMDNQIDAASASLRLKARFDNPAERLWPGQSVDVRMVLGMRSNALVIPEAAVQRGAEGLYVYVVQDDDRVRVQPVRVLEPQDGLVVLLDGLEPGERVVVDGQYRLRPGTRVMPAPGGEAAPGRAGS